MTGRMPLIAGNWKMHKTVAEAQAFLAGLLPLLSGAEGVEVAVCAPFTALRALVDSARGSRLRVFAQNGGCINAVVLNTSCSMFDDAWVGAFLDAGAIAYVLIVQLVLFLFESSFEGTVLRVLFYLSIGLAVALLRAIERESGATVAAGP